ncbi:MAG: zona occludens toxin [Magnetococcales bacterium]|nr:zona occludens toxin [Magnetococcales bacterium]
MSIKIHHGPPGAYKTSGAMNDDFIEAVFSGRPLVTNVRGLDDAEKTRETLQKAFPKREIPATFEIIHLDHNTQDGADKWMKWFHWVPIGSFLLVDEGQDVWKEEWRDSFLQVLDYPGGSDKALEDGRPKTFKDAFQRHRHFNWDMVLTTPDIKSLRKDILGISECAYFHKNLAVIGINGRYVEAMHLANRPANEANFIQVEHKKVPAYVFDLYESTNTGKVSDSQAGKPLWKQNRFLFYMALLVLGWVSIFSLGLPSFMQSKEKPSHATEPTQDNQLPKKSVSLSGQQDSKDSSVHGGSVVSSLDNLSSKSIYLVGAFGLTSGPELVFEVLSEEEIQGAIISGSVLETMGYEVKSLSGCLAQVKNAKGGVWFARCRGIEGEKNGI